MNKQIIEVPREIRYISDWDEFPLQQLSTGHCIVNKTITGCGYTHYSLTNNQPIILCSPRKFLLENKYEQLKNDYFIHLVINKGEKSLDVDQNLERNTSLFIKKSKKSEQFNEFDEVRSVKDKLNSYLLNCHFSQVPPKILVTYDSLKHVIETLGDNVSNYLVLVDEFQNIFMDSRFKANTELNFVSYLQECPNVTYLSATPYIEEYLDELDEFKNLPYYELKWDPSRLRTIEINYKKTSSINKEVDKIINFYKNSQYPIKVLENKNIIESKEVVFYVNSVRMICSIIKRNNLTPDQVNIICADTSSNVDNLIKLGHSIGKAPLRGEPHKMFTFCTRTTYVGADFYSTCASSVIVSDCKIDSLSSDIRMDFPQIMGRQRLKENVFRNECTFIFSLADNSITMKQFEEMCNTKLKLTEIDIKNYNSISIDSNNSSDGLATLLFDLRNRIKNLNYSRDYTGISVKEGKPVINKLVLLAEKRAFELRSGIYRDVFSVYEEFNSLIEAVSSEDCNRLLDEVELTKQSFESLGRFVDKMKIVCSLLLGEFRGRISVSDLTWVPRIFKNYLNSLGPEKIRALGYEESELKAEILNRNKSSEVWEDISKEFVSGNKYSLKSIKERLKIIYERKGITKTPKATDLENYFNLQEVLILDPTTKKRVKGYLIQSLK